MRKCLTALIITTSLIAMPASAQSRKELAAVDVELQQRLTTLERRMLTGDPAAERLMQRMDSLETAQRSLTGEIERLVYERDTLQSEVQALSAELQGRQALIDRMQVHLDAVDLVASEQRAAQAPRVYGQDHSAVHTAEPYTPAPLAYESAGVSQSYESTTLSQVPAAPIYREETIDVQSYSGGGNDAAQLGVIGQTKLAEGDFIGAQTAFKQYLEYNPDAADAGEMNFWLGESYFVRGGYADAADAYISSMRKDPDGVKAPESMVRLAATLRELGNQSEACQTLATFGSQFPNAPEAAKEKARVEASRTGC